MQLIIERPIITEKSLFLASRGWYTFAVHSTEVRKEEVIKALKAEYGVDVVEARMIAMHGKSRRVGKKMAQIAKLNWKKAVVKLKKGQHIDAFEVTQQQMDQASKPEEKKPAAAKARADKTESREKKK